MDLSQINVEDLQQLAKLKRALDDLGKPDPDAGARLHAEKNSPAVSGLYSELRFPPYEYREFPRMVYHAEYLDARTQLDLAQRMILPRGEDQAKEAAIKTAERRLKECTRIVQSDDEMRTLGSLWGLTPDEAKGKKEGYERDIAQAAAEAAYDDRRLGDLAKRERDAIDADHEGHLVEVPETPKAGPRTRVTVK